MSLSKLSKLVANLTKSQGLKNSQFLQHENNNSYLKKQLFEYGRSAFPSFDDYYLFQVIIAIGVIVVLFNSYLLSLFLRFKVLRRKSNIFPLNLIFSDLFLGIFVIPVFIVVESALQDDHPARFVANRRTHHQNGVLLQFNTLVSIYSLAAIIINRTFSVCLPLKHRLYYTARKAILVVILIWLLSAVFASFSFVVYKPLYGKDSSVSSVIELLIFLARLMNRLQKYEIYSQIFYWVSISGAMICGIALLVTAVIVNRIRRKNTRQGSPVHKRRVIEETKVAIMLSCMFSAVLLWIVSVAYFQRVKGSKEAYIGLNLGRFALSILNPILYTLLKFDVSEKFKKDFAKAKNAVQSLISSCFHKLPSNQGETNDKSDKISGRSVRCSRVSSAGIEMSPIKNE